MLFGNIETVLLDGNYDGIALSHSRNGTGTCAASWQTPHRAAVNPAESCDGKQNTADCKTPSYRSQHGPTRMTRCREHRREKDQIGTGLSCPYQIDPLMRRTRYWSNSTPSATPARAQMQPRAEHACQTPIACDHKNRAPRAAECRQFPAERRPVRVRIVAEHHAAQSPRQARHHRPRVRKALRFGEQPQWGQDAPSACRRFPTPRLDRARPCDKPEIHDQCPASLVDRE
jgi:hypothetical protein